MARKAIVLRKAVGKNRDVGLFLGICEKSQTIFHYFRPGSAPESVLNVAVLVHLHRLRVVVSLPVLGFRPFIGSGIGWLVNSVQLRKLGLELLSSLRDSVVHKPRRNKCSIYRATVLSLAPV